MNKKITLIKYTFHEYQRLDFRKDTYNVLINIKKSINCSAEITVLNTSYPWSFNMQ